MTFSGECLLYCLTIPLIATALANQDDIFLHKGIWPAYVGSSL